MRPGDILYRKGTPSADGTFLVHGANDTKYTLVERASVGPCGEIWTTAEGELLFVSWDTVLWHYGSTLDSRRYYGR